MTPLRHESMSQPHEHLLDVVTRPITATGHKQLLLNTTTAKRQLVQQRRHKPTTILLDCRATALSMVLDVALSGCRHLDTLWPSKSGQFTILMFPLWRWNIASSWSVLCIRDITLFWHCQTGLLLVLLCHCRSVDRNEEKNNTMVIVGSMLVSSQTPPYYDTVLYNNSRIL